MPTATRKKAAVAALTLATLPAIGAAFAGGIFAGVSVHQNKPVALVLLPGDVEMDWKAAQDWAKKRGGELPSRIDQLVLFENLKKEFQQSWYWSGQQHAADSAFAWRQFFDYGFQHGWLKSDHGRARAVRRLPIR